MSCCNKNPTSFSPVSKTWNGRSSLSQISSWDPYPELLNKKTGSTSGQQPCIGGPPLSVQGYIPMQYSGIVKFTPKIKEGYLFDKNPADYSALDHTWGPQKDFSL